MNTRQLFFSGIAILLQIPLFAYGAGLVPCGGPNEPECQTCHVLGLINSVTAWLVGVLSIAAAIMFMIAGYKIVTAGGNPSAIKEAKSMMTNVAIGFIIVLAAWILIDLMMKTLLGGEGDTAIGPWNAIACVDQPRATTEQGFLDERIAAGGSVGITGGSGTGVTEIGCRMVSPDEYDCREAELRCIEQLGGAPAASTEGSAQRIVNCAVVISTGSTGVGGSCNEVTDVNNACHPSKLNCFGNAQGASRICNLESAGGDSQAMSGSDLCADSSSFSGGLWQINILANNRLLPNCSADFYTTSPSAGNACDRDGDSAQGGCLDCRENSAGTRYCAVWNCRITDRAAYQRCVNDTKNPEINSQAACSLYSGANGWAPWRTSANKCGVS